MTEHWAVQRCFWSHDVPVDSRIVKLRCYWCNIFADWPTRCFGCVVDFAHADLKSKNDMAKEQIFGTVGSLGICAAKKGFLKLSRWLWVDVDHRREEPDETERTANDFWECRIEFVSLVFHVLSASRMRRKHHPIGPLKESLTGTASPAGKVWKRRHGYCRLGRLR